MGCLFNNYFTIIRFNSFFRQMVMFYHLICIKFYSTLNNPILFEKCIPSSSYHSNKNPSKATMATHNALDLILLSISICLSLSSFGCAACFSHINKPKSPAARIQWGPWSSERHSLITGSQPHTHTIRSSKRKEATLICKHFFANHISQNWAHLLNHSQRIPASGRAYDRC